MSEETSAVLVRDFPVSILTFLREAATRAGVAPTSDGKVIRWAVVQYAHELERRTAAPPLLQTPSPRTDPVTER